MKLATALSVSFVIGLAAVPTTASAYYCQCLLWWAWYLGKWLGVRNC